MENISNYNFIKKIGDITDDGIAVYDIKKKSFLYVNANFTRIFSIDEKDLFFDSNVILKFILAEDSAYLRMRYEELLETGCINTTEFRLVFPDHVLKHISCDMLVLEDTNLITAFVKDVSEAKKHEDYLIKYTAQKDTLLDMLTHNLSGPLQLSKDMISSLQKGYNENNLADINKLLNIMQENTQQCIDIVNDFLRQEHFESAHTYVRKTRFDLVEKIHVTLDKLRAMNKDKVFTLTSESENINITSDAVKFFQIIHNILSNAIKFTGDQGVIEINVQEHDASYLISFKDNGVGIPDADRADIFLKKVKGRMGLKGEKSSGLGLSIAKKLVDLLNGQIWFESKESEGSTFYLRLPKE
jgi:two-component system sensor histidine kinase VicK